MFDDLFPDSRTLSWTPGADEHQEGGGWIEGEHVVTKPYERREGGTDC